LSPIHFPAPTVPAFSQYLHKEFKAFLEKEKVDLEQAQQVVDLALKLVNDFSGTGLRSNRFLTGLIGCLTMDHPDVVAHLKKQETDQPRIVLAEDKDIAAAAKEQALREKSRIVIPGAHAHDHEHHGHRH
jgi:hypothetical protein